ncbi:MAG: serine protein kinase PrkA [Polyangiaceae bacterium]|nr:serine protein kinase PrkA [Polyangiaceae bacterium]
MPTSERSDEGGATQRRELARRDLEAIARGVEEGFRREQRVVSFGEYLDLFAADPVRYSRNAAQYLRDVFRHYGRETRQHPWGKRVRYRLFDAPYASPERAGREPRLVGQDELGRELYRAISNFAREGRVSRLVLMHGPNGSAKSTAAACIMRALEHYSTLPEGALYRFHWVFPSRKTVRGAIGFGSSGGTRAEPDSYAHLDESEIDARLFIELRDHPLFLLPLEERRRLVEKLWPAGDSRPPEWLLGGELAHKNMQIFDALLTAYHGNLTDVLRHVQVQRFYVSRRYRLGAVTLGPQMSVDAGERQITMDRSVASLPSYLQATTLFEAFGELIEAAGGVLEFSDLLKRPIDTFRYLQNTLETGEVSLPQQNVTTNVVMIGSANDIHMAAFREHPEYASFLGRMELVRVGYLRSCLEEQEIYDKLVIPQVRRHVAPHATRVAAEFAVLTRMRRPDPKRYAKALGDVLATLTALEKMVLYADGTAPNRLDNEDKKLLRASVGAVYEETDGEPDYEGKIGVSPRVMRTVVLDAGQRDEYGCLSPFAILAGLEELCRRVGEFEWLKLKPQNGGYHDHAGFRAEVRTRLMDQIELDMREASGMVAEEQYHELFKRYIDHVSTWTKGEKMRNPLTGKDEDPDERMMREVEGLLGVEGDHRGHRQNFISLIAAWAIDHPGAQPRHAEIFPAHVPRLQAAAFARLRKPFALLLRDVVTVLHTDKEAAEQGTAAGSSEAGHGGLPVGSEGLRRAEAAIDRLVERGYCRACALDATSALLRERYADLVT